uniref:Uncharacterized protein n=1 Tax=Oryza nivara TaxID=4536 RepID=A0A0E0GJ23_ORYNI
MRTLFEICLRQRLEDENVYLDRLYGIEENDIGALIHSSHPGKVFPYVNLSSCVSPITRTVLKVIYKTFRISYMETINDLLTYFDMEDHNRRFYGGQRGRGGG